LKVRTAVYATETAQTLGELEWLRLQTRRRLEGLSFPLVLFGGISLVAAALSAALGEDAQGFFWALAGPAGGVAVSLHYRRRELDLGLSRAAWPYICTAVALMVACFVLGFLEQPWSVGPWLAVAAGYLVFGALERSAAAIVMSVTLAALAVAVGVLEITPVAVILNAVYGVAFIATGVGVRARRHEP